MKALFTNASAAVVLTVSLCGCATFGSPTVYGEIPECERLIPPQLKEPVPSVAIPGGEDAEAWMQAFVGQTGALDKANERAPAVDHIYRTCLQLHRSALERSRRGFLARIFG
jgi:hypothetical protein